MAYHNTDICACNNEQCADKWECLRYRLWLNQDKWQVFSDFSHRRNNGKCQEFINVKQYKTD